MPRSRMVPPSTTKMTSARRMVESRCAMTMEVLPSISRSSASNTSFSDAASSPELGSSRIRIGAVANHGARDGDALPLAAGQRDAALSHYRVVPLRHLLDELAGVGQFGCAKNLGAAGARLAVGDIVPDGSVEQQRLLQHEADLLAQRLLRETADVQPVDSHRAGYPDRRSGESG